ncbi:MAG: hypothetical protein Solumvirus4_6 [Solumvirus sp.]|uniref:Uncharacterized protein n=1 Tax=Solumvirus sp. TaxID=2487773 RepID=A0A3G5AGP9_9VIRU|nr:MAG: hypothetical protein Solumvirus4_6 [Solumvirus sp.]
MNEQNKYGLCEYRLPDYSQDLKLIIPMLDIRVIFPIIEEYLLDEDYLVSKILIAASIKDLVTLKKYYDPSKIVPYDAIKERRHEYQLTSQKMFDTVYKMASYAITDNLKDKSIEMTDWLIKTSMDKVPFPMPVTLNSLDTVRRHFSYLPSEKLKRLILQKLFPGKKGNVVDDIMSGKVDYDDLAWKSRTYIANDLVEASLICLAFKELLQQDPIFRNAWRYKVTASLGEKGDERDDVAPNHTCWDQRVLNEVCIIYYLLPYFSKILSYNEDDEEYWNEENINGRNISCYLDNCDYNSHSILVATYFNVTLNRCEIHNLVTNVYGGKCVSCDHEKYLKEIEERKMKKKEGKEKGKKKGKFRIGFYKNKNADSSDDENKDCKIENKARSNIKINIVK